MSQINDDQRHHLYRQTLSACPSCDVVMQRHNMKENQCSICPRCGSKVEYVQDCCPQTLKWTVIAALFFYIPANFYPLVSVEIAGTIQSTSVFNGVILLIEQQKAITAAIVLFCSLIVPTFVIVTFTALLVVRNYHIALGFQYYCVRLLVQLRHWSMLDIYLISFLITMFKVMDVGEVQMEIGIYAFVGLTLSVNKLFVTYDRPALWRLISH
ncbi:MAG: paraquat-inducible protein A [Algicola sp.]|nr:paraquat-inducible protein A [Algicola sp.]